MWWQYLLVFLGAVLFDIVPFPFAPAFTIMVVFQILFDLHVWTVIVIGVMGSVWVAIFFFYIRHYWQKNI